MPDITIELSKEEEKSLAYLVKRQYLSDDEFQQETLDSYLEEGVDLDRAIGKVIINKMFQDAFNKQIDC